MLKIKKQTRNKVLKKKKKPPKQKKIVGGIELYGHSYMLIVGQVHLFRLQSIKKFMHNSNRSSRFREL